MKRATLVVFFSLLFISSFGQKIRFSDSSNIWNYFFLIGSGPFSGTHYSDNYIGDTVINNVVYKRLFHNLVSQEALIREDTVKQKVYLLYDSTEVLLYDFTLKTEDTFTCPYTKHFVTSIDTLLIAGKWHKVWHLQPADSSLGYEGYDVVEGIGSTSDPLYPLYPHYFETGTVLTCFVTRGMLFPLSKKVGKYFDNDESCRQGFALGLDEVADNSGQALLFPNPADVTSKLVLPYMMEEGTLVVYNCSGSIVSRSQVSDSHEVNVGAHIEIPGLYLYNLTDKYTGRSYHGKFVYSR